jgi:hypothetical protein
MKAEHRKELQTNSLADFLGRTVQGARGGTGISWFKVFVVLIVLLAVLLFFWVRSNRTRISAEAWAKIEYGDSKSLAELYSESKDTTQGQAALFTLGYGFLWDGIHQLGDLDVGRVQDGLEKVFNAAQVFDELANEVKNDNERLAEAKYHSATAYEALAAFDASNLEKAKNRYEELTKGDLAATAFGALAKKRYEQYEDIVQFANISTFYREFRQRTQGARSGQ